MNATDPVAVAVCPCCGEDLVPSDLKGRHEEYRHGTAFHPDYPPPLPYTCEHCRLIWAEKDVDYA